MVHLLLEKTRQFATLVGLMADDALLKQIGKLLEAERAHTRKMVREEVAVEGKRITSDQNKKYISLEVSLNEVRDRVKDVAISNGRIEEGQAQQKTMLEAVAAGQKELQETVATKADVLDVGTKIDKIKKRIDILEDEAGITHKN